MVYPNPADANTPNFNLQINKDFEFMKLNLTDLNGRTVASMKYERLVKGQKLLINKQQLSPGIYIYR